MDSLKKHRDHMIIALRPRSQLCPGDLLNSNKTECAFNEILSTAHLVP